MSTHTDGIRQEERESRLEAAPAVAVVIGLQVALAVASHIEDWTTWQFHWWIWLIPIAPELALLLSVALKRPHRQLEQMGLRREAVLTLTGLVSLANALLIFVVIASLIRGDERSGTQLLMKAGCVWATNVIAFALWYWALDRGGPVKRWQRDAPLPDFQFPQMENPQFAPRGWMPQLLDYLYVSFTNSIAFSPTDAMPLTRRAKFLMLAESVTSSLTILLVAARAVNIFK